VSRTPDPHAIGPALASFALTALAVGAAWWWLGAPVVLPPSPLGAGAKLYCVSYAPFRGSQSPLAAGTMVEPSQIDADLAQLAKYTDCVRTYSVEFGQDKIPGIARQHGLKVLHGLWLSNKADKNRQQIATTIALAKQYPDVITAVVVGNEVLLRGEMSATDLMATLRAVKSEVPMPVTYADVWEYWLRYPDVQNAVDFVTIHILPYWEDFPLPAAVAAAHVADIRARIVAAIPTKEILVGEIGWPSAGRMREGARPSPVNQARVIAQTLAVAQREGFRVNVIEAFDQPWKRALEGATGAHWGIFDRSTGAPKFAFSGIVSDHPHWLLQGLAGILLTALTFAGAFAVSTRQKDASARLWPKIAALSFLPAVLVGWTIETVPVESFTLGGWLRTLAFAVTAAVAPIVCAAGCAARRDLPTFASLFGRTGEQRDWLHWLLGSTLVALMLLSVESALGLVFDPRYRDIPFAPVSGAVIPFLGLVALTRRAALRATTRAKAEIVTAAVLSGAACYILFNESFANWQAVWFCAGLIVLALILAPARNAPG